MKKEYQFNNFDKKFYSKVTDAHCLKATFLQPSKLQKLVCKIFGITPEKKIVMQIKCFVEGAMVHHDMIIQFEDAQKWYVQEVKRGTLSMKFPDRYEMIIQNVIPSACVHANTRGSFRVIYTAYASAS